MVLTTPMVMTKTHGIESLLLNHTHTRGPSVTRMWDFLLFYLSCTLMPTYINQFKILLDILKCFNSASFFTVYKLQYLCVCAPTPNQ